MDSRRIFADNSIKEEFLDRFEELAVSGGLRSDAQLESMTDEEAHPSKDDAVRAVDALATGQAIDGELEAIIRRFTRPVLLVQNATWTPPSDQFPNAKEIESALGLTRSSINQAIRGVGRLDLRNHRLDWAGTAWLIADDILVTNQHVAQEFARKSDAKLVFRSNALRTPIEVSLDCWHEHQSSTTSIFRVLEPLWMQTDDGPDIAFLRVEATNGNGERLPAKLTLMTDDELESLHDRAGWVAAIGYPAQDGHNDIADQQRLFDGIYGVKRLAPGKLTSLRGEGLVTHDATTLAGNSGSVLIDVETGKAAALHFGGIARQDNYAVQAPTLQRILNERT